MLLRAFKHLCYCLTIILALSQFAMASGGLATPAQDNPTNALLAPGSNTLNSSLGETPDFLPVDEAFQANAWITTNPQNDRQQTISLNWQIAPGYYLYRHRFAVKTTSDNSPVTTEIPPGKAKHDEYFGDVEVFYDQVSLELPLEATRDNRALQINYQGCADAGLCYPPQTLYLERYNQTVVLSATPPQAITQTPPPSAAGQNDFTRILSTAGIASIIGIFFLAGLALTFTPCVLPMIPIVSSIVLGQSQTPTRLRAFSLSLTYVLAMAGTYALAGTLTGYFGAGLNLQLHLQSPLVIITIAALFVAFALAMLGLYELRLPAGLQSRLHEISHGQRGGTYAGVAVIGIISTLIVSPCVTAPLAGTLIFISSTGDPAMGGTALLSLGLGMGLPLLLIGTFGAQLLPRSGPWMHEVKVFFGVLLLGLAIWMLDRITPPLLSVILWVSLLTGYALHLGVLKLFLSHRKVLPAAGLALMLLNGLLVFNASHGHYNPFTPFKLLKGPVVELAFQNVNNLAELQGALASLPPGQKAMLDLYADWCVSCLILEQEVFPQPEVSKRLQQLTLLRADITKGTAEHQALLKHFGLFGPPSLLFFEGQQELRGHRIQGEIAAQPLQIHLSELLNDGVKETDILAD